MNLISTNSRLPIPDPEKTASTCGAGGGGGGVGATGVTACTGSGSGATAGVGVVANGPPHAMQPTWQIGPFWNGNRGYWRTPPQTIH